MKSNSAGQIKNKKRKVLVIESDGPLGDRISEDLKREGYAVTLARDSAEALKAVYETLPHLILLDSVLSGGDSYDILKKKQAEHLLAKIPVFLLSTQGIPIYTNRIPPNSVTEYIVIFSSDSNDIVQRVNRHFGSDKK